MKSDVPQCSFLPTVLYTAYINDLPTIPKVDGSLFADDTMFYTSNKNQKYAVVHLQSQVDVTSIWLQKWKLHINITKTQTIVFGTKIYKKHLKINIEGRDI